MVHWLRATEFAVCDSPPHPSITEPAFSYLQLDKEKLERIPILKRLRALEEQAGKDVTLGTAPVVAEPSLHTSQPRRQTRQRPRQNTQQDPEGESKQDKSVQSEQKARQRRARVRKVSGEDDGAGKEGESNERGKGRQRRNMKEKSPQEGGSEVTSQRKLPLSVTTVYLGGIPTGLRVSELKTALREREATPLRLTWQGAQHRAFLDYSDPQAAEQALEALQDLSVNGHSLQAELAKSQRGSKRSRQPNRRPGPSTAPKTKTAADTKSAPRELTEQ